MSKHTLQPASTKKNYVVNQKQLPLSCPTREMELWNAHPKVYLPIEKTGQAMCPYCGACFVLEHD
ncbi:MAG: hypothetical protein CMF38_03145 [Legionellaceae bacterium]|nr:hypothetical protein [Legionellaceae bacterium]|tara:strand:- start:5580 stop:5774 length:195 start_codon:yes stop_codon:yes gene_type:complete